MDLKNILLQEPLLVNFLSKVKALKKEKEWCDRIYFWGKTLKPEMVKLVGFNAKNIELRNSEAYDIIYDACIKIARI